MDLMRRRLLMAGNGLKDYTIFGKSEVVGSSVLGVGDVKNWNQLWNFDTMFFGSGINSSASTKDSISHRADAVANAAAYNKDVRLVLPIISNHKYLFSCSAKSADFSTLSIYVDNGGSGGGGKTFSITSPLTNTMQEYSVIGTILNTASSLARFKFDPYQGVAGATFTIQNPQVFDLTAIFGSGNEPTSVEGFKSWLVSVGKMKSADGEIPYFPYDAGSTFASLPIVALKGYESVNLGDLAWYKLSDGKFYTAWYNISDYDIKISGNKILHGYTQLPNDSSWNILVDHTYGVSTSGDTFRLMLGNTDYTLASALKTALTGTMFYYERESATEVSSTTFPLAISSPLHGVGTADFAKFTDKGITRKDFVIDMGSLNYNLVNNVAGRFVCSDLRGMFAGSATSVAFPALSAVYHAVPYSNAWTDNLCMFSNAGTTGDYIYFRNDAYSDVASFKAAMSGVQLVLQLAEETFESVKLPKLPKFKDGTLVYTDTEIHGNITTE